MAGRRPRSGVFPGKISLDSAGLAGGRYRHQQTPLVGVTREPADHRRRMLGVAAHGAHLPGLGTAQGGGPHGVDQTSHDPDLVGVEAGSGTPVEGSGQPLDHSFQDLPVLRHGRQGTGAFLQERGSTNQATVRDVRVILLTNDDGIDSPSLVPFARALTDLGRVRVVVPDRERSWVGKAITRFEPVTVEKTRREGIEIWACSGYPADAVQLGVHGLFDNPPDLVVSGINLGYNHGAGFLMSSGTVGAAVEAWVSGVPSVALSTGSMDDWHAWKRAVLDPGARPAWERLAAYSAGLVGELLASGVTGLADVVSVNLPFDTDSATPRRLTTIARVGYDRLFRRDGPNRFVHEFGGGLRHFEALEGTDVDAAHHGWVSITPLRMPQAAEVPAQIREILER